MSLRLQKCILGKNEHRPKFGTDVKTFQKIYLKMFYNVK